MTHRCTHALNRVLLDFTHSGVVNQGLRCCPHCLPLFSPYTSPLFPPGCLCHGPSLALSMGGAVGSNWGGVWNLLWSARNWVIDVAKSVDSTAGAIAICGSWLSSCTCEPWWQVSVAVCNAASWRSEYFSVWKPMVWRSGMQCVCWLTSREWYTFIVCTELACVSTLSVSVLCEAYSTIFLLVCWPRL